MAEMVPPNGVAIVSVSVPNEAVSSMSQGAGAVPQGHDSRGMGGVRKGVVVVVVAGHDGIVWFGCCNEDRMD